MVPDRAPNSCRGLLSYRAVLGFFIRRLLSSVLVLLFVILVTFALLRGAGGDPFRPPEGYAAPPAPLQNELREYYNLDEPWFVEFLTYVREIATLHFGPSLLNRDVTVDAVMRRSFPTTLQLVLLATAWAVPLGIALGVLAARRRGTGADVLATSLASALLVIPVFFVAYVVTRYFARDWGLVPFGWGGWESRIAPSLVLALAPMGYIARLVRAAVVDTLGEDYVRTARAKGLYESRILWTHVLRNSLVPFLSAAMPMLALLITGALFVEQFFGIPGAATGFLEAARTRDYPLLLGLTAGLSAIVLVANLVADLVLAYIDPRVRESLGA
jgi:ABC-type dipeptide/oligopeptide/nickel transport system permease component